MKTIASSACGRFAVLNGLHIDRRVFDAVALWADQHGLQIQDAIQLALCGLRDGAIDPAKAVGLPGASAHAQQHGRPARARTM